MTIQYQQVVDALERGGWGPVRDGAADRIKARCPAHRGGDRNLKIRRGDDGRAMMKCWSHGCHSRDIFAALKIEDTAKLRGPGVRGDRPRPLPTGSQFRHWIYRGVDGAELMAVVRWDKLEKDGSTKIIRYPLFPVGNNLWEKGPVSPENRPIYGQPRLKREGPVMVVEGEKCADIVAQTWPRVPVVCWQGGTNTWHLSDWSPVRDRNIRLLADADHVGRKAMVGLSRLLRNDYGCNCTLALPGGDSGEDVYDWIVGEGPQWTAEVLRDLWEPHTDDLYNSYWPQEKQAQELSTYISESVWLERNEHYRLLGTASADRVVFRMAEGFVVTCTKRNLLDPDHLITLAPEVFWMTKTRAQQYGKTLARRVGDELIRAAHRQGPIDLGLLRGRGAARTSDRRVVWHMGDRLVSGDEDIALEDAGDVWLTEPAIPLSEPATNDMLRRALDAIESYRWEEHDDGRRFAGWLVAALVAGALDWRPHLMLVAPASTGKSWLLKNVVQPLFGPAVMRIADASSAALARLTATSSLPLVWDEAEPDGPMMTSAMALLRVSAGAEGLRLRAEIGGQGLVMQEPRFAALLSATATPDMKAADASRIVLARLGSEVDDWPHVSATILRAMHPDVVCRIRSSIIRACPGIVARTEQLIPELAQNGTRNAHISAALTAGYEFWHGQESSSFVEPVLAYTTQPDVLDAADALQQILALPLRTVRKGTLVERPVGPLLAEEPTDSDVAEKLGMRLDNGLIVATSHPGLKRAVRRTGLAGINLKRLLLQIPGARETTTRRFGVYRGRAVHIDHASLRDIGVEFKITASWTTEGLSAEEAQRDREAQEAFK